MATCRCNMDSTRGICALSVRRWILAIVTFALLGLGTWCCLQAAHARSQREMVREILSAGGLIRYDWQPFDRRYLGHYLPLYDRDHPAIPPGPTWLRQVLGDDYFQTVVAVALRRRDTDSVLRDVVYHLPSVEEIYLDGSPLSDAGLQGITALRHLKVLALEKTHISDAGLAECASVSSVEYLSVAVTHISDAGLVKVVGLTHLRHLNLSATDITDHGLDSISQMRSLESLELLNTAVSSKDIYRLAKLSLLKSLTLGTKATDDESLREIAEFPALQTLELNGGDVTEGGLLQLAGAKNLVSLRLNGVGGVTAEGIAKLRHRVPKVDVIYHSPVVDSGK
jgi:Leucine Rich repeat